MVRLPDRGGDIVMALIMVRPAVSFVARTTTALVRLGAGGGARGDRACPHAKDQGEVESGEVEGQGGGKAQ